VVAILINRLREDQLMMKKSPNLKFLKIVLIFSLVLGSLIFFLHYTQRRPVKRLIPITSEGGYNPSFSPDGEKIAFLPGFSSKSKRREGLWVSMLKDNKWEEPKQLSKTGVNGLGEISWSPDGERVTYIDYWNRLCIVDMNGNERILKTKMRIIIYPKWSPDGSKICFVAIPEKGKVVLKLVNVDGSGEIELATGRGLVSGYSWSPDGRKIVYVSKEDGRRDLWMMSSDGSNKIRLTKDRDAHSPAWSPDGSKIAFLTGRRARDLWVMSVDEKRIQQLTFDGECAPFPPVWSPDGTKLAYEAFNFKKGSHDIWVINSDGTGKFELDPRCRGDSTPSWSPDGKKIAYYKNDNIWIAILK
jgi:Tol biopolymer transport system component